jgi:predicted glycosyltransferase/ActR/RegA family two-component response regulator
MEKVASLLIVEDERVLRRCLEIHFCGRGMDVSVAGSLSEARALLVDADFDATLLDVGLPDGDGLSLLPSLSADRSVVITANPDFERFEALGVKHVVPKPLDLDVVARVVDGLAVATSERSIMTTLTDRSTESLHPRSEIHVGRTGRTGRTGRVGREKRELPKPGGAFRSIPTQISGTAGTQRGFAPLVARHVRCSCTSTMFKTEAKSMNDDNLPIQLFERDARLDSCKEHAASNARSLRIMLYSHDTVGLGHFRRNLVLARALSKIEPRPSILMISGCAESSRFEMPPGVDVLTLPALRKVGCGEYAARSLDVSLKDLIALRAEAIQAAARSFGPDLVIVDNVPRGAECELDATLQDLREQANAYVVLGLRDVLDEPRAVAREWDRLGNEDVISAYYDSIWVYGDPIVADHGKEYGFDTATREKIEYVGYLDRSEGAPPAVKASDCTPAGPFVLCLVGGGEDGCRLAESFAEIDHLDKRTGLLLLGPFMPTVIRNALHHRAAEKSDLVVLDFVVDPIALIRDADCVITMGGHNSVSEVLSFERPVLIVPRVEPRREQWLRAHKLANLGLADVCELDELSPVRLESWIETAHDQCSRNSTAIDMGGLVRVREIVKGLAANRLVANGARA